MIQVVALYIGILTTTVDCPACQIGCRWYKHGKSFTMISISFKVPHYIKSYTCEKDFMMLRHKMRYGDLKCLDLIKYSQSVVVIGLVKRDPEFKFAWSLCVSEIIPPPSPKKSYLKCTLACIDASYYLSLSPDELLKRKKWIKAKNILILPYWLMDNDQILLKMLRQI